MGTQLTLGGGLTIGANSVGVNTTTPGYTLDVAGGTRSTGQLVLGSGAQVSGQVNWNQGNSSALTWGSGPYSKIVDDSDLRICTDDTMHFYTGLTSSSYGTERITIGASGVGINNAAPAAGLDVGGNFRVSGPAVVGALGSAGALAGATVQATSYAVAANNQGAYLMWNRMTGTGATTFLNNQGGGSGGYEWVNTYANGGIASIPGTLTAAGALNVAQSLTAAAVTASSVLSGATVGAGTTTPSSSYALDVAGTSRHTGAAVFGSTLSATGNISAMGLYTGNTAATSTNVFAQCGSSGAASYAMDTATYGASVGVSASTGQLGFCVGGGQGAFSMAAARMVLNSSSQLGVGTTAPAFNLDVAGSARASGAILQGTSTDTSRAISCLNQGMAANAASYITLGQSTTMNNEAEISFYYAGPYSISNRLNLGLYSTPSIITVSAPSVGNGVVGINTTTPQATLDVSGNLRTSNGVSVGSTLTVSGASTLAGSLSVTGGLQATAAANVGLLYLTGGSTGAVAITNSAIASNVANSFALYQGPGGDTVLNSGAGLPLEFKVGNVERGRFDPQGNLGVGTTTPQYTLDVAGGARVANLAATGNVTASGLVANVGNLNVLYCSNIVGYQSGVANTVNITGNSLVYTYATANTLTVNGGALSFPIISSGSTAVGVNGGTGDRIILYPGSSTAYPYSIGISPSAMYFNTQYNANTLVNNVAVTSVSATGLAVMGNVTAGDAVLTGNLGIPYSQRLFCTTNSSWMPYLRSQYNSNTLTDAVVFSVPGGQANGYSNVLTLTGNTSMAGVGIGTTSPTYSLDVAGALRTTGTANVAALYVAGAVQSGTSGADPGDLISKVYAASDRYGIGQYAGGRTRVITSSTFLATGGNPTVGLAYSGANSSGASNVADLLVANSTLCYTTVPLSVQGNLVAGSASFASVTSNTLAATQSVAAPTVTATTSFLQGTSTDSSRAISCLNSAMATGTFSYITLGQQSSNNNQAEIGFYYAGSQSTSNRLNLGLFGTQVISIQAQPGLVGINTTAPAYSLDIAGTMRTTGAASIQGALAANNVSVGNILTASYVGVGITPQWPLDVSGGAACMRSAITFNNQVQNQMVSLFNGVDSVYNTSSTGFYGFGVNSSMLRYQVPSGSAHTWFAGANVVANLSLYSLNLYGPGNGGVNGYYMTTFNGRSNVSTQILAIDNNYGADMAFGTAPSGTANLAPIERMRITQAGLIGIGTSTPQATLDISGNLRTSNGVSVGSTLTVTGASTLAGSLSVTGGLQATAAANVGLLYLTGTGYAGGATGAVAITNSAIASNVANSFALYQGPGGDTVLNSGAGLPLEFKVGNVERGRFDPQGNLGVGTTTPQYTLDVAGGARVTGAMTVGGGLSVSAAANFAGTATVGGQLLVLQPGAGIQGIFNQANNSCSTVTGNTTSTVDVCWAGQSGNFSTSAVPGDGVVRVSGGGRLLLQAGPGASAVTITANGVVNIGNALSLTNQSFATPLSLTGPLGAAAGTGVSLDMSPYPYSTAGNPSVPAIRLQVADLSASGNAYIGGLNILQQSVVGNANTLTSRIYMNAVGSVGIGTTTPQSTLDVNGQPRFALPPTCLGIGNLVAKAYILDIDSPAAANYTLGNFPINRTRPYGVTLANTITNTTFASLVGQSTYYSGRLSGWIAPPTADSYSFMIGTADDGCRVHFNNQLILNASYNNSGTSTSGTFNLAAGQWYPFSVEYWQVSGGAGLSVLYKSTTIANAAYAPLVHSANAAAGFQFAYDGGDAGSQHLVTPVVDNQLLLPSGSLAIPSVSFTAQTGLNAGLYQPVANTVGVVVNSSEVTRFTATGINCASLAAAGNVTASGLYLGNSTTASNVSTYIQTNSSGSPFIGLDNSVYGASIGVNGTAGMLGFCVGVGQAAFNPANRSMVLSSTGSLGIGTTTPAYSLDVAGSTRASAAILQGTSTDTSRAISCLNSGMAANAVSYITLGQSTTTNNEAEISFYYAGSGSISNRLNLGLCYTPSIITVSAPSVGNGIVGINTTTPQATLDVSGNLRTSNGVSVGSTLTVSGASTLAGSLSVTGGLQATANANVGLMFHTGTGYAGGATGAVAITNSAIASSVASSFALYQGSGGDTVLNSAAGTPLEFKVGNVERGRFDAQGNLGVGTSAPAFNLDVSGSTRVTGGTTMANVSCTGLQVQVPSAVPITFSGPGGPGVSLITDLSCYPVTYGGTNGSVPTFRIQATDTGSPAYSGSLNLQQVTTNGSGNALTSRVFVNAFGSVGLGTTTPAATLDVNGGCRVTGSFINNNLLTWFYKQTVTGATATNNQNNPGSLYTKQTQTPFSSASLLTSDAAIGGVPCATLVFPTTGVYSLSWTARFTNSATENAMWFAPVASTAYGETGSNSNGSRLGTIDTSAMSLTCSYTGYFASGDTLALAAYSSASNQLNNSFSPQFIVTLLTRTA